jgi:hypothetical protein
LFAERKQTPQIVEKPRNRRELIKALEVVPIAPKRQVGSSNLPVPTTSGLALANASRFIWSFIFEYFFEDFGVSLPQELCHPLISHTTRTQPCGMSGTEMPRAE